MEDMKADLRSLFGLFSKSLYRAKNEDEVAGDVLKKCLALFAKDYHYFELDNCGGELSSHYPSRLIVLEYEKCRIAPGVKQQRETFTEGETCLYQSLYDVSKLQDLCQRARRARCRARFPIPVILVDGKHICRSATLSGGPEIYGRTSLDFLFAGKLGNVNDDDGGCTEEEEAVSLAEDELPVSHTSSSSDWQLFDRVRSLDIRLLKQFSVTHICDLMVEKKKVKFGMNITSSEKVDKENRYADFTILSLPYPGCEFFREYSANGFNANGLVYAWNQAFVDAQLVIPSDSLSATLDVDWNFYKTWDAIQLTQNYFKLILKYIANLNSGLLIHCISGWDRTPLFVSLLRLSLWADGEIHGSLGPLDILYLTLAYDWYLFGHNFPDRLGKGEEILFFCFDFLKYITSDEYSFRRIKNMTCRPSDLDAASYGGGILDDILVESGNPCGSNTSLNSSCSSISSRSQDYPPSFFTTSSYESSDEFPVPCGNLPSVTEGVTAGTRYPSSSCTLEENGATLHDQTKSSTPVAVPAHFTRHADNSAFSCGSWQIISGTGSLRGSTSAARDSGGSSASNTGSASDHSTPSSGRSRPSRSSLTLSDPPTDNEGLLMQVRCSNLHRARRLSAVRKSFYDLYASVIGFRFCNGMDSRMNGGGGSGLSGLLDHFAEKVGIRTGRGAQ